jgi:hypothetical protein
MALDEPATPRSPHQLQRPNGRPRAAENDDTPSAGPEASFDGIARCELYWPAVERKMNG